MLLSAGGTVLLERLVEKPEPRRSRRRRPRRRLARGRDVRLERPPPRRAAGRGLPHSRPRDPAPLVATKEPTPEQLEVGSRRWRRSSGPRPHRLRALFGRIDHIGVAVEDIDAALALYEDSFEMELAHRETVESQGVEAVLLDVGEGHVELLAPLGPDTPVGKYMAKNGPGLHHVAYAVDDIDAALERHRRRRHPADRLRAAGRHPRQPRRLPPPPLHRRGPDRDRRTRGRTLMAEAQRVEIGFEGGQVISTRLGEEDLKDLRARLEQGGWHDLHTEEGTIALYLGKVQFLRIESGEHRVGFGQRLADAPATPARRGGRGDAGGGALVAQEPLRLPLRPALLGRSPAPDHHPRAAALGAAAAAGRTPAGDRRRHRLLQLRAGRMGRARTGRWSCSTCSRSSSTT